MRPSSCLALHLVLVYSLAISVTQAVSRGIPAFYNDFGYDREAYGLYPKQVFRTTNDTAPHFDVLQSSAKCDRSLYTLMTPRGAEAGVPQATILDAEGRLVWTTTWGGQQLYNLMVQEYKGEKYLTFWAGDDTVGGHGAGFYYMLDKHYNIFLKVGAANGLDGDLHDFRITPAGTAMITVYQIIDVNLRDAGKDHVGPVWDCLIQEVDLATGDYVFEWRATSAYKLSDSYREIGDDGEEGRAYDFFHMNSIDKDAKGNYLTSSRYTHSITYINGTTGEVIWILGGKRNMFLDLSNGRATNFQYQHDARWSDNFTTITMFDNGVDDTHPDVAETRGLRIRIDTNAMTAAVVAEYSNPHHIHGISQGSCQTLNNGNTLVGYGNTAAFTEYAYDGTVLCDTHFGPESRFGKGDIMSYRVYKYEWHGWPQTRPAAAVADDGAAGWKVLVSWNGATEVSKWRLQGAESLNASDRGWREMETISRVGFESEFVLRDWWPPYLRVLALDSRHELLGASEVLKFNSTSKKPQFTVMMEGKDGAFRLLVAFCAFLSMGILGSILVKDVLSTWWKSRRASAAHVYVSIPPNRRDS